MPETWFQVVTDDEREAELGPKRQLLADAQTDKRNLVEPGKAKIKRVSHRERGASLQPHARHSCEWGRNR